MKNLTILFLLGVSLILVGCGEQIDQTKEDKGPKSATNKAAIAAGTAPAAGAAAKNAAAAEN